MKLFVQIRILKKKKTIDLEYLVLEIKLDMFIVAQFLVCSYFFVFFFYTVVVSYTNCRIYKRVTSTWVLNTEWFHL